jgi:hypothetical protein
VKRLQIDLRHPRVESRRSRRALDKDSVILYALGGVALVLCVVLGVWLAGKLGFDRLASALTILGVAYAVLSLWQPAWYWNGRGIAMLRDTVGDRGVLLTSLGICGLLSAAGIHRMVRLDGARTRCAALFAASRPGASRAAVYAHRVELGPTDWLRKGRTSCRDILTGMR